MSAFRRKSLSRSKRSSRSQSASIGKPLEKEIQKDIVRFLDLYPHIGLVLEYKQIARVDKKTGKRFFASVYPGVSDLIWFPVVSSSFRRGTVTFIEVKRPGGKHLPSQKDFQKRVQGLGYTYIIAKSIDDVKFLVGMP